MELDLLHKPDFSHRVLNWVDLHRNHLVMTLVGAILFFGLLAAVTSWVSVREGKAQVAYFETKGNKAGLENVIANFPKSHAATLALIDLASGDLNDKNFDSCIARYGQVYDKASRQIYFRVLALHGIGTCQRAKGDLQTAAQTFERAAKEPGNLVPFVSRFEEARCLEALKDPKAGELYNEVLTNKDLPPEFKEEVEEQLIWLRLQKNS